MILHLNSNSRFLHSGISNVVSNWKNLMRNSVYSEPYKHFYFRYLVFKTLFTSVAIICDLVLVSSNSTAITCVIKSLFKILSILIRELVWILSI